MEFIKSPYAEVFFKEFENVSFLNLEDSIWLHLFYFVITIKVFWCFQGVEKGCIGNEWVKTLGQENA